MSSIASCVHALCGAICSGNEEGELFARIRTEVQALAALPWPEPDGNVAVVDYLTNVPSHRQACMDLDFQGFSATMPLLVGGLPLHLHHILEAFSRTNPHRYGSLWLAVLDLAQVAGAGDFTKPRQHIETQLRQQVSVTNTAADQVFGGVADPNAALDTVMQNILSSFPGLQGMMQQIMTAGNSAEGGGGGLPMVMQQIQGLLYPLLTQASQNDPDGPNLQPAVAQIIQGFTGLTQALSQQPPPPPPAGADPSSSHATMDE